jgi:hypothetical protein
VSYEKFIDKEIKDLHPSTRLRRPELTELRRMRKNKYRKNTRKRIGCYREDLDPLGNIISLIKSRGMRRKGHVTRTAEIIYTYKIVEEEPEGKIQLTRSKLRKEINIKKERYRCSF